eukprot:scaffold275491_cov28-Tisochrysis_lutea.AAC.6
MLIKLFKNFKEVRAFKPPFQADAIYGGALLGVRSGEVCPAGLHLPQPFKQQFAAASVCALLGGPNVAAHLMSFYYRLVAKVHSALRAHRPRPNKPPSQVTFFYDWSDCRLVRRIDVQPREVRWSDTGDMVALVTDDSLFLLR